MTGLLLARERYCHWVWIHVLVISDLRLGNMIDQGLGWWKARNQRGQKQKVAPMTKRISNTENHPNTVKNKLGTRITQQSGEASRPGGKLGAILKLLEQKPGATVDALINKTGWQKHSVHGALSKLRARGFDIRLESVSRNRKAYRIVKMEA